MRAFILLLLLSSANLCAQSCYICLTKQEAVLAADSALSGQHYKELASIQAEVVASLQAENAKLLRMVEASQKQAQANLTRAEIAEEQNREYIEALTKARKPKRALRWLDRSLFFALGLGTGILAGSATP